MFRHAAKFGLLVFAVLLYPDGARADIYKCVDADGMATYSQAPCQGNPQTIEIDVVRPRQELEPEDCRPAYRFAFQVAQSMQDGASSSETFNRFGGLNAISAGTLNLVNFVYGYRASDSITPQKLAGQAQSRCQSGALSKVACEDLPTNFTDTMGGCGTEQLDAVPGSLANNAAVAESQPRRNTAPVDSLASATAEADSRQCHANYRNQIERIDEQMRGGYTSEQGETYREQRRYLQSELRRC